MCSVVRVWFSNSCRAKLERLRAIRAKTALFMEGASAKMIDKRGARTCCALNPLSHRRCQASKQRRNVYRLYRRRTSARCVSLSSSVVTAFARARLFSLVSSFFVLLSSCQPQVLFGHASSITLTVSTRASQPRPVLGHPLNTRLLLAYKPQHGNGSSTALRFVLRV